MAPALNESLVTSQDGIVICAYCAEGALALVRIASEWPIETTSGDPVAVQALVAAIDRAQQNDLAAECTSLALPYLVAWLQRDEAFPRPALEPVYSSLLTLFALGNARGASIYDSTQILVSAILASGLDQKGYGTLIADVREIGATVSVST